ncbi:MAG: ABC transporter permease [Bacteroidales bacterium]
MHFIKTIFRNFTHNQLYTAINIFGLAIGLSCFTFILLFIQDELSYDKHVKHYKQIYRIDADITISDRQQKVAKTSFAIGPAFQKEFPEVEDFVRFRSVDNSFLRFEEKKFYENLLYYTDSSIFRMFNHAFIFGNPETALKSKNSIVLTKTLAEKYFGSANPMGQLMNLGNKINCKVTGVIEDVPDNSHVQFEGLISMESYSQIIGEKMYHQLNTVHFWALRLFTFIKLKDNSSIETIYKKFPDFHDKHIADISKRLNGTYRFQAIRLDKIHLFSDAEWDLPTGDIRIIYIFTIIAIFILLIASINYMNLATARSSHKAKEVGVRKVLGAYRANLARLLIGESIILAFFALVMAIVIVESTLPFINNIWDKHLHFELLGNPIILLILITTSLLVGVLSGFYPSFYLSSFQPVIVLKGVLNPGRGSGNLRKSLIVFQFTISIIMIVGTLIVTRQMNFIKIQDLGFKKENLMVVRSTDTSFKKEIDFFKNELLANPNVYNISTSNTVPGGGNYMDVFLTEGKEKMEEQLMSHMFVDYNYIDLMGMTLISGRKFNPKQGTDINQSVIINWKAAQELGWNENALGKEIHRRSYGTEKYKVIGVLNDFHYSSLYEEIGPMVFFLEKQPEDLITIRINPKNKENTIAYIEQLWAQANPNEPFKYDYLDDILNELYTSDDNLQKVFTYFALLSILISLLGLFGLSSFITEQFSKNIGIRKLLGALGTIHRCFIIR